MDPREMQHLREEGERDAEPAVYRLRALWSNLQHTVAMPLHKRQVRQMEQAPRWRDVSRTKSQRIAQTVRGLPPVPKPLLAGLGVVALGALLGRILWRRQDDKRK
jgi:hypothetical protein